MDLSLSPEHEAFRKRVRAWRPDLVISCYPLLTVQVAELRRRGRLRAATAAVITAAPLAAIGEVPTATAVPRVCGTSRTSGCCAPAAATAARCCARADGRGRGVGAPRRLPLLPFSLLFVWVFFAFAFVLVFVFATGASLQRLDGQQRRLRYHGRRSRP